MLDAAIEVQNQSKVHPGEQQKYGDQTIHAQASQRLCSSASGYQSAQGQNVMTSSPESMLQLPLLLPLWGLGLQKALDHAVRATPASMSFERSLT